MQIISRKDISWHIRFPAKPKADRCRIMQQNAEMRTRLRPLWIIISGSSFKHVHGAHNPPIASLDIVVDA